MILPACTGYCSYPSVCVLEKNVAAPGSHNREAGFFKQADHLLSLQSGKAAHIEICWMPTSSPEGLA